MNDDEIIEAYMLRVNEVINVIRGLREKMEDSIIMKKVLGSPSQRFDPKVSTIEAKDLNTFNMDEMHDSLTAYEMRIGKGKSIDKKATFKVKKKIKAMLESDEEETSDELEVNSIHKLKKGTKGKYKEKFQFKCFNYGGIGHFIAKYPHNKKNKDD